MAEKAENIPSEKNQFEQCEDLGHHNIYVILPQWTSTKSFHHRYRWGFFCFVVGFFLFVWFYFVLFKLDHHFYLKMLHGHSNFQKYDAVGTFYFSI